MSNSFFSNLASSEEPYALAFAGQGTNWLVNLGEILKSQDSGDRVRQSYREAKHILEPLALDLMKHVAGPFRALDTLLEADSNNADAYSIASASTRMKDATVSVPGILLAQLGALVECESLGCDWVGRPPQMNIGHSQGILGAALAKRISLGDDAGVSQLISLSILIGYAATTVTRRAGANATGSESPMLSIRGIPSSLVSEVAGEQRPSVINGRDSIVYSSYPQDLSDLQRRVERRVTAHNQTLENRERGGSPLIPVYEYLSVDAPFHSDILIPAHELVMKWVADLVSQGVEWSVPDFEQIAHAILVDTDDWVSVLDNVRAQGIKTIIDLGPTESLTRISERIVDGTGVVMVSAGTVTNRLNLATAGYEIPQTTCWMDYAPSLVSLPDGRIVTDTAFTRLTGRSPIMLPGMTPTTVWPEIVAAAANAGNWAELAGGGQYSEEVFSENETKLRETLEPGRAIGFNAMFFDRYMWNLQFGVSRIVPKARQAGAPIDAVTIAAGIPEIDEARELLEQLRLDGFNYLCLKPGTIEQINAAIDIAEDNPNVSIILQVEDGQAGGHHSWESLDDLLLATYGRIRQTKNIVLAVGGGIGTPERAADYITGRWALQYAHLRMPVDAVMVGTASMATKEAGTSPQVKQRLVDTPGIQPGDWVGRGASKDGMTSGLSHLDADMYEVDNASARAARLIHEVGPNQEAINERRQEIIDALARTAKPYFGDVTQMTYAQWVKHVVELTTPSIDWTWTDRVLDLFHRVEGRLSDSDHGNIETLFPDSGSLEDPYAALDTLLAEYPQAATIPVSARDAAWFPTLCRKHVKPMPFVPALDAELARWWGTDTLWQSHDDRFDANEVRIIPGPVSVGGIERIDEPIGEMFARYENAVVEAIQSGNDGSDNESDTVAHQPRSVFSRLADSPDIQSYLRSAEFMEWNGNLVSNPAHSMPQFTKINITQTVPCEDPEVTICLHCDSVWDDLDMDQENAPYRVRVIDIPVIVSSACSTGGYPVVDMERISKTSYDLLEGAAGVGTITVDGDHIDSMPSVRKDDDSEFGVVNGQFTYKESLGPTHASATGAALTAKLVDTVPDALVGPCWPSIYTALGTAMYGGYPVIEGLVNAVHLDHTVRVIDALPEDGSTIDVVGQCAELSEASSGRVVRVEISMRDNGREFAQLTERFAIRGRVTTTQPPAPAPTVIDLGHTKDTPRSFIRAATVTAPADMTAFAIVSGDYNPIHTSYAAAGLSGLQAPLVHGMWLSATAQHLVSASGVSSLSAIAGNGVIRSIDMPAMTIVSWSYQMYGMVNLDDEVDIVVERVGHTDTGQLVIEVTCRVDGNVVSLGRALLAAPVTAYLYPGQGIQRARMGMEKMTPTTRAIWARADAHTREKFGFSIEAIVRDNPTSIRVRGEEFRHPEGVLNLTQFTQVALAALAYAQTEDLMEQGVIVPGALYAGHSLGEYNALASCRDILPLEQVIEIVYQRGSAMHHLVPRDENGRSNYQMGALRPNQFGVGDDGVRDYVESISQASGEFLEIVNYNLKDSQYAVAGTIAGIRALQKDSQRLAEEAHGKRPFMLIPGIDVPFHSSILRAGVPQFREKLDRLLPQTFNVDELINLYIPNLVARPFELTEDFAQSICNVVPSEPINNLIREGFNDAVLEDRVKVGRMLLIELLAWQFASPVRWIETQDVLFKSAPVGTGAQRFIEIGLASAPTLTGLAEKTLQLPEFDGTYVEVLNSERDEAKVLFEDVVNAPHARSNTEDETATVKSEKDENGASSSDQVASTTGVVAQPENHVAHEPSSTGLSSSQVPALPVKASEAVRFLLAYSNKITPEQLEPIDTVDTLTNGVSSKRNQLLMDMAGELGVPTIDGAAEAQIGDLLVKVDEVAGNYHAYGPVLSEAIGARLRGILGAAGLKPAYLAQRVTQTWGLAEGWVNRVSAHILLATREGDSVRGGALATLDAAATSPADIDALIDAAVQQVAQGLGIDVVMPGTGSGGGGELVDSGALKKLREEILGSEGILANQARTMLDKLGVQHVSQAAGSTDSSVELAVLDAELGSGWMDSVTPAFNPERAVLFDDRWASAREELARVFSGQKDPVDIFMDNYAGGGQSLRSLALWYAGRVEDLESQDDQDRAQFFKTVAETAVTEPRGQYQNDVALVTGGAPHSIATAMVARLLRGGATVVMTASSVNDQRLAFAKKLYSDNAAIGAVLWLVPANLASFRDVDTLIDWISTETLETVGASTIVTKPALLPTLFIPFAAPRVYGTLGAEPAEAQAETRLLLWSIERSIERLSRLGIDTDIDSRTHVILPGSPNRGTFGGDGAYGEVKAAFDAIVNKWHVEKGWPSRITLAHPLIGWVQGTSLMGGNDLLVPAAKEKGIHVFTTDEIADRLLELATPEARTNACHEPLEADLTGGLATADINLAELASEQRNHARREHTQENDGAESGREEIHVPALPNPVIPDMAKTIPWADVHTRLQDQVVIVGLGEVGTWGSGRTRTEAEYSDDLDLTAAGVLEMAWMMGLVTWSTTPQPGWYDVEGNPVAEADIYDRFRDEVLARSGIRVLNDDATLIDCGSDDVAAVHLDSDQSFTVDSESEARAYLVADPSHTTISLMDGEWVVTKRAGSVIRVPRRATLSRSVGGQIPLGFDPERWGIPPAMVEALDRIAVWNLVTAVDAFISAGFTPAELLQAVHPGDVSSTQGTGIGGMQSLRQVFLSRFLGEDRPQDILQEALPNVVAAHTMQSFVGGYGQMIHSVGACATAAVSVEEAVDKIRLGKSAFVVAGGIDDISVESLTGFGDMHATADSKALLDRGITARHFSRAGDRRRAGFLEAEGGGTVLVTRGDIAADLGLPVHAVIAFAQSFADGAHTSIPAPGIGALGAARGGENSRLACSLKDLGITPDDIAVISKHDTSTNANDPNEAELHSRLSRALGRSEGNPLYVISQKTLTGHAKGGAALFQVAGLCDLFARQEIPANHCLDCLDPVMSEFGPLVWLRSVLDTKDNPVRAALLTSLGFGHVAALIALVHPSAFESALRIERGVDAADVWRSQAVHRLRSGRERFEEAMSGGRVLFESIEGRRLPQKNEHEVEVSMLLDPDARLGADGKYHA